MIESDFKDLVTVRVALLRTLVLVQLNDESKRRHEVEKALMDGFAAVRRIEKRHPRDDSLPVPVI